MIVKKESEEAERKRAYTNRVLGLLYPEEHASSVSGVDQGEGPSDTSEEAQSKLTSSGTMSALEVTEGVQLQRKRYGVSSPPPDLELSYRQENLQEQASDVQHSSSKDLCNDDLPSTRRRRRRKRQRTSHNQPPTSSAEVEPAPKVGCSKVTEEVESTESMSRNRKRKLKKKLKNAERKQISSKFVYRDILETRTEDHTCSETHIAGDL